MPRTDEQIAQYMEYYSGTVERKWAFENLCRTEHKTPDEITEICARFGITIKPPKYAKFDEKITADVVNDSEKGLDARDIAQKRKIKSAEVQNIITGHRMRAKKFEEKAAILLEPVSVPAETVQRRKSVWYALLGQLEDFAIGTFGAGTSLEEANVGSNGVSIAVKTADGKPIVIKIKEEQHDEQ